MSNMTQDTPFGVSVDSVDHKERERELDALQKGIAAHMLEDSSLLAGERPMGSSAIDAVRPSADQKGQKKDEFHQALILLNDYLERLDQILDELRQELTKLYEKRQAAVERMDQLFQDAHDIDDLIAGIKKDGMSPEEARAVAKLLGKKADGQSPEEIVILLGALQKEKEAEGRKASGAVDELDAKIAETERQIKVIEETKEKGLEARTEQNSAKVYLFSNDAEAIEEKHALRNAVSSDSSVENRTELKEELETEFVQDFSADVEFGF